MRGIGKSSAAARRHGGPPDAQGRSALLRHIHCRKLALLKAAEPRTHIRGPLFRRRSNAPAARARTAQNVAAQQWTLVSTRCASPLSQGHKEGGRGRHSRLELRATYFARTPNARTELFSSWAQRTCAHRTRLRI